MRIGLLPPDLSGTSIDQVISMEEVLRNAHRICQIFKLPIFDLPRQLASLTFGSLALMAAPTRGEVGSERSEEAGEGNKFLLENKRQK